MNCDPYATPHRLDLARLASAGGHTAEQVVAALVGEQGSYALPVVPHLVDELEEMLEEAAAVARDTGRDALFIGLPLIEIVEEGLDRILAPLVFVPIRARLEEQGRTTTLTLEATGEAGQRIVANDVLLGWVTSETGYGFTAASDERAWVRINDIATGAAAAMDLLPPEMVEADTIFMPAPDSAEGEKVIPAAVLGVFPQENEEVIRDLARMADGTGIEGAVAPLLTGAKTLGAAVVPDLLGQDPATLVVAADPMVASVVASARSGHVLIEAPPGTAAATTVANLIADALLHDLKVLAIGSERGVLGQATTLLEDAGLTHAIAVLQDAREDGDALLRELREEPSAAESNDLSALEAALVAQRERVGGLFDSQRSLELNRLVAERFSILPDADALETAQALVGGRLSDIEGQEPKVRTALDNAVACDWGNNPWRDIVDVSAVPDDPSAALNTLLGAVEAAEGQASESYPLTSGRPDEAAEARGQLADRLANVDGALLEKWAKADPAVPRAALAEVSEDRGALDTPVEPALEGKPFDPAKLKEQLAALDEYQQAAESWKSAFAFGAKNAAREVLEPLGLPLDQESATRARAFLAASAARHRLRTLLSSTLGGTEAATDAALRDVLSAHQAVLDLLHDLQGDSKLDDVRDEVLANPTSDALLLRLRAGADRAPLVQAALDALAGCPMFHAARTQEIEHAVRYATPIHSELVPLAKGLLTLPQLLKARGGLASLKGLLAEAAGALAVAGVSGDVGWTACRAAAYDGELAHRREAVADLPAEWSKLRTLAAEERRAAVAAILTASAARQSSASKEGLESAPSLRRYIEGHGAKELLELRRAWIASPSAITSTFSLEALFDVVIVADAASLPIGEGLPAVARGKRLLVVDDPGLSPAPGDPGEVEEDGLSAPLRAAEDVLTVALRSSMSRLALHVAQPGSGDGILPSVWELAKRETMVAVPSPVAGPNGIVVHRVGGTLTDRRNAKEANAIVACLRELQGQKLNIRVVCATGAQHDEVLRAVDDAADQDPEFGDAFDAASDAGDLDLADFAAAPRPCDVLLVSFTYGEDASGEFVEAYGPLEQLSARHALRWLGGARCQVQLFHSLPADLLDELPDIPPGRLPTAARVLLDAAVLASAERAPGLVPLAEALAARCGGAPSAVGRPGARIDVAIHNRVAILCDDEAWEGAADPVAWELWREAALEAAGWDVRRIWSAQHTEGLAQVREFLDEADLAAVVSASPTAQQPSAPG